MYTHLFIEYFLDTGYYTQKKALPFIKDMGGALQKLQQDLLKDSFIKGFRLTYQEDNNNPDQYTCKLKTAPYMPNDTSKRVTTREELFLALLKHLQILSKKYMEKQETLSPKMR